MALTVGVDTVWTARVVVVGTDKRKSLALSKKAIGKQNILSSYE